MKATQIRRYLGLVFASFLLMGLLSLNGQNAEATGPLYRSTYPSKITHKLGNGVGNIVFCWAEIPYEINHEIQDTDLVTGFFVGLGKGIYYTGQRLVLGVVDVVTFPIDVYGNNYQTVQRTKFPFVDEVE